VIVDHQVHWYPRAALELLARCPSGPRADAAGDGYVAEIVPGVRIPFPADYVDLDRHFASLDAHGIDAMVSSPAVWLGDPALYDPGLARELMLLLNEEAAGAQRAHPDRFVGVAVLPVDRPDTAVGLLEEAVRLGLRAACVHSNVGGMPIATEELMPLYARMDELDVTLFLHPTLTTAMTPAYRRYGQSLERVTWFLDTSAAALALIFGGVLDACPTLTVVHPHAGGVLPFLRGRIEALADSSEGLDRPFDEYFRTRFYTDSVTETPGAIALAAALYGEDRILFATDHPWFSRRAMLEVARDQCPAALNAQLPAVRDRLLART
jgi:predicted TIM-barrel fold metal-dependent hydrolase